MSNYMIVDGELYHHGIKGMKWGVRRYQNSDGSLTAAGKRRAQRADIAINRIQGTRARNKETIKEWEKDAKLRYAGNEKKLKKASASRKAAYDISEVTNRYAIARQKAKKDPSYKESREYKKARAANTKQVTDTLIYGNYGKQRIETLKNLGKTDKQARAQTFVEVAGVSLAVSAAMTLYAKKMMEA